MSYTLSHSLYILYTPRSRCRSPIGATSILTKEVVPFLPGVETGRPPQHLNLGWASLGWCLNLSDPGTHPNPLPRPQFPMTPILIWRGGHVQKRCLHGPN
ncbi:hypothetical protein ATANTOWER_008704 [Ataeniobius toweri]|uniref:Uncharacterized protein n=1 Tax=Ataeniobius toweri TaxID=208326 RepID=A0ABU7B6U3_9TELE|nr:hypothetical protein [Ataeniobius toweri]